MPSDWPGLKPASLYQGRDLQPTTDMDGLIKGLLAEHLAVDAGYINAAVFPDLRATKPMSGLIRV